MKASKTSFIGRLAADPMMLPNTTGDEKKDRCWFRVITNRRYGDKLDSHACLAWGAQGRAIADNCSKGKEVYVEGEPHIEARPVHDAAGNPLLKADGKPLMTNYYEVGVNYCSFGADSKKTQDERAARQGVVTTATAPAAAAVPAELTPEMAKLVAQVAAGIVAKQAEQPQSLPNAHDPIPYVVGG